MEWRTATIDEVMRIVKTDLANCNREQISIFEAHRVEPYFAPISRLGKEEQVVVVARNDREVIYWEDVEEGFGLSPVGGDGRILEHDCNQNDLGMTLNAWMK